MTTTPLTDADYIAQRLDDQMTWYEKKSASNQQAYKRLRMVELVAAALIPLISGMGTQVPQASVIVGLLGVLIALAAGAMSLFKYHENWLQYRTTAEQLKHERFMYLSQTGPYAGSDRYATLVERVEKALMKELAAWTQAAAAQTAPGKAGAAGAADKSVTPGDDDKPPAG
ncbi:MAG: hypothetical protein RLZZ584_3544 [Pseudomonadota bacterium]|jgi:hypothetical protein